MNYWKTYLNLFNLPAISNKFTVVFPSSFFAKQVYHPLFLKATFWTSRVEQLVTFLPLVSFPLYHVMTAGGFPISTGQPIDLSSPNSNSMVELDRVADGLSRYKKVKERFAISMETNITRATELRLIKPISM